MIKSLFNRNGNELSKPKSELSEAEWVDRELAAVQGLGSQPKPPNSLWNMLPKKLREMAMAGLSMEVTDATHQGMASTLEAGQAVHEHQLELQIQVDQMRFDLRFKPLLTRGKGAILDQHFEYITELREKHANEPDFLWLKMQLAAHDIAEEYRSRNIEMSVDTIFKQLIKGTRDMDLTDAAARLSKKKKNCDEIEVGIDDDDETDYVPFE